MDTEKMIDRLKEYGIRESDLRLISPKGLKALHDKYFPEFAEITDLVLASGDHAELTDLGDYQNEHGEVPENEE